MWRCRQKNPEAKRYNLCLKDDINIRYVSLEEMAGQASVNYLSTLAVLQLDAILTNSVLIETTPANPRKRIKVQYCITAIDADKTKQEAE